MRHWNHSLRYSSASLICKPFLENGPIGVGIGMGMGSGAGPGDCSAGGLLDSSLLAAAGLGLASCLVGRHRGENGASAPRDSNMVNGLSNFVQTRRLTRNGLSFRVQCCHLRFDTLRGGGPTQVPDEDLVGSKRVVSAANARNSVLVRGARRDKIVNVRPHQVHVRWRMQDREPIPDNVKEKLRAEVGYGPPRSARSRSPSA